MPGEPWPWALMPLLAFLHSLADISAQGSLPPVCSGALLDRKASEAESVFREQWAWGSATEEMFTVGLGPQDTAVPSYWFEVPFPWWRTGQKSQTATMLFLSRWGQISTSHRLDSNHDQSQRWPGPEETTVPISPPGSALPLFLPLYYLSILLFSSDKLFCIYKSV